MPVFLLFIKKKTDACSCFLSVWVLNLCVMRSTPAHHKVLPASDRCPHLLGLTH